MERCDPDADWLHTNPGVARSIVADLSGHYGTHRWSPSAARTPVDELILTVLSQNTSDTNTDRAFASLRNAFPTWEDVERAPTTAVAEAIRSGGLSNIKAPRIQKILGAIRQRYGGYDLARLAEIPVMQAERELTSLHGVGAKTAACVLLFSLGEPVMPVDTHVSRLAPRIGLSRERAPLSEIQDVLERTAGHETDAVLTLHLNLLAHGRAICQARTPKCGICFLADRCRYRIALQGN